jgi:hypothetical protein
MFDFASYWNATDPGLDFRLDAKDADVWFGDN